MASRYTVVELDGARLRLIDAIPEENHRSCRPFRGEFWESPYECDASYVGGYKEIAESLALRETVAERLLDGFDSMPSYEETDEGLKEVPTVETCVGDCMLRRALGICPLVGAEND